MLMEEVVNHGLDINTRYGVLNIALRHVKDTRTCMSICQTLLEAAPRLVNDDQRCFYDRFSADIFEDAPLIAAVSRVGEDCLALTHLLLDQPGLDPYVSKDRMTCLYYAAKHASHSHALLSLLLSYGVDPYYVLANGRTVLERLPQSLARKVLEAMEHARGAGSFVERRGRELA